MPIDGSGRIVCVTHTAEPMFRQPGYYFLSEAEKTKSGGLNILIAKGVPQITYVCRICGYIENYAAVPSGEWTTKKLYVKCKNDKCNREFASPIQMDENGFNTAELNANQYQCYYCQMNNTYDKNDHFFK